MTEHFKTKRTILLQPFREEHHEALLLCWKIRIGLRRSISVDRIKIYTDWFYANILSANFMLEEDFLFPLLGRNHPFVKKALTEHRRLKRLFNSNGLRSLNLIEEELENHIRFKEMKLLNEIEATISEQDLDLIMKNHVENVKAEDWGDEFWKQ